jgi:hypothetical protein
MTSDFFDLAPSGLGSIEVECFPSFFYRLAELHSVSMHTFSQVLSNWWSRRASGEIKLPTNRLYDGRGLPLCGYNDAVASYVGVVSNAIERNDVVRTTLLALHGVADKVCHGALKQGRAWCPACMNEAVRLGGCFYDRLLWSLLAIERCPEHRLRLVSVCPQCGIHQRFYHSSAGMTSCWKCAASLLFSYKRLASSTQAIFWRAGLLRTRARDLQGRSDGIPASGV